MARIAFKSKVRGNLLPIPTLKRSYCDMPAFRDHAKYGPLANSDIFLNALARIRRDIIGSDSRDYLRMDSLPGNVTVDAAGFLAVVTIDV